MKKAKIALACLTLAVLITPTMSQSAGPLPKQDDQVQQCVQRCSDDWDFRQDDCRTAFLIDTSMSDYYACGMQNSITYQHCKRDCQS